MISAQDTQETLTRLDTNLSFIIEESKKGILNEASPDGKYQRTFNLKEGCFATGIYDKKFKSLCEELKIDSMDGKKWCVSLDDIHKLKAEVGILPFKDIYPLATTQVFCISSLKGGCGKTTFSTMLASGLSIETKNPLRVGVIDLDPQGTATAILKPNFDNDSDISAGDLLMELVGEGETVESLYKEAFYPTSNPYLRILCARGDDRSYDGYVRQKEVDANKNKEVYLSYSKLQEVIDVVKDEFDVILIDTPPQFSAASLAGHFVANHLIVPMRPSENDKDSSSKYATYLSSMYSLIAGMGHSGYESIDMVITALKKNSPIQYKIAQQIALACGENMAPHYMYESDAITNTGSVFSTIFDISASEYDKSPTSLRSSQDDCRLIVNYFERKIMSSVKG